MGRRAAPSQRMAAAQAHAASRAIVPESALPFGGAVLPSAPKYAAPAWWPDEGEEYILRAVSCFTSSSVLSGLFSRLVVV